MKLEILHHAQCELGEGPMWHPVEKVLYWVDILGKKVHRYDTRLNVYQNFTFDFMPGAVLPTNTDLLLIAFENGIATFDTHSLRLNYLTQLHENQPYMRCNDAKCDPFGNLWVGTMSKTAKADAGNLYCLKTNLDFSVKIPNTSISNGTIWNQDGSKMYYIDSIRDSIRSYDFDKNTFEISNERTIIHHPEMRYFDGMTIDTEGMLWVAHCTDSCVRRWNPETGEVLLKIDLPCPKVTSLTFGGEGYRTLFITTAQEHMTAEEVAQYPTSGATFVLNTDYQGFATNIFKLKS
jgi:sugar lactone lactonase YvrE